MYAYVRTLSLIYFGSRVGCGQNVEDDAGESYPQRDLVGGEPAVAGDDGTDSDEYSVNVGAYAF